MEFFFRVTVILFFTALSFSSNVFADFTPYGVGLTEPDAYEELPTPAISTSTQSATPKLILSPESEKFTPSKDAEFSPANIESNFDTNYLAVSIMGGVTATSENGAETIPYNTLGDTNTFYHSDTPQWGGMGGASVQYIFHFNHHVNLALGPAVFFANLGDFSGAEAPDSNFGTNSIFNYQFHAKAFSAMLESRLIYSAYAWQPICIVGVGNSWNHLSSINITSTDPNSLPQPGSLYTEKDQSSFSYEIGVGIQHQLFADQAHDMYYTAGVDYRYFHFGSGELGLPAVHTVSNTLSVNSLSAQALIATLSVAFG